MKNFNKLHEELKKENCLEGFIKLLEQGLQTEVTVKTVLVNKGKSYLSRMVDTDAYFLIVNKHNARNIKSKMKTAKRDVLDYYNATRGYKPIVKFKMASWREYARSM